MSSICLPPVAPMANQDCLDLHRAFEGFGCDGPGVIRILAHRTAAQRSQIQKVYMNMFNEDLYQRLKSELHLNFQKTMLLWMQDESNRSAKILKAALKSNSSKKIAIFAETFSLKSSSELASISEAYRILFGRALHDDMGLHFSSSSQKVRRKGDPLGGSCDVFAGKSKCPCLNSFAFHYFQLFLFYLQEKLENNADLKPSHARDEAMDLYNAGEGSSSLDDAVFIHSLTAWNRQQLSLIFESYKKLFGHAIHKGLKKHECGDSSEFVRVLQIITKCIGSPADYFAKVLYKSMKGLGTDNDTLIRVVVTHAEVDMAEIKTAFLHNYRKSLAAMVTSDTSGNYRKFLLALIGVPY